MCHKEIAAVQHKCVGAKGQNRSLCGQSGETLVSEFDIYDREKIAALKRIKLLATLVLVGCFCLMIIAKLLEHNHYSFAILAAFAEAATIGGIADWYAVVALFKRPLNLPFPHTAIIPSNQHRIAANLGAFIETNFLAPDPIRARLQRVDFAGEISQWLSNPVRSASLAGFAVKFVPQLLRTIDEKDVVRFATERVATQLARTDVAPLINDLLNSFAKQKTHKKVMDQIIATVHRFLNDEETLRAIRGKVQDELPLLFNVFRADQLILQRIVKAATALLDEVKEDPDHELRAEFDAFLKDYIRKTRRSKKFAKRVEEVKVQILARPELTSLSDQVWASLSSYILDDVQSEHSVLAERLADLFVDIGTRLEDEPDLRRDINEGMVSVLSNLVAEQRSNISAFVTEQVNGWDMGQLTTLIEMNVGRDLQYIRFNGMIIGGCVGVVLFGLETLLLS
jgi:uncharacterized membrane-anchored protein YjiN (DUF445 family)